MRYVNGQRQWKWLVRGYYAANVKPPKTPGDLAIEVGHDTDSGKDMELLVFNRRPDIGEVDVIGPNY